MSLRSRLRRSLAGGALAARVAPPFVAFLPRAASSKAGASKADASRSQSGPPADGRNTVGKEVEERMKLMKERSRITIHGDRKKELNREQKGSASEGHGISENLWEGKFRLNWREQPGHKVPYRFRLEDVPARKKATGEERKAANDEADKASAAVNASNQEGSTIAKKTGPERGQDSDGSARKKKPVLGELPYTAYSGLRFPTLETAESYHYHADRGLHRVVERAFPIKVPGYRRLDPYLREYIHFLHTLDPARFTIHRIAERYRLRAKTVRMVVKEWSVNRYLTSTGLTKIQEKQTTKEAVILAKKEEMYARRVGWDQLGDEDDPESDDEAIGEPKGWRSTNDWVRRQNVEVEMMQAFPMMEKRDPMPKRVDVDLVVDNTNKHKIINWLDPTDKVVF